jgi:nitrate reductase NapE component
MVLAGFIGAPLLLVPRIVLEKEGWVVEVVGVIGVFPLLTVALLLSNGFLTPTITFDLSNWVFALIASATTSISV